MKTIVFYIISLHTYFDLIKINYTICLILGYIMSIKFSKQNLPLIQNSSWKRLREIMWELILVQFTDLACDVCASKPCRNNAICVNSFAQDSASYKCFCSDKYTGNLCESGEIITNTSSINPFACPLISLPLNENKIICSDKVVYL